MVLFGLTLTVLDYGFILLNFNLDFVAQGIIIKPVLSSATTWVFTELKTIHDTQTYIWKQSCSFLNQLHCMVN